MSNSEQMSLRIDTDALRTGADRTYEAARLALQGADQLSRERVTSGIFGDFAAAASFGGALSQAHSKHMHRLREHQQRLGALGDDTHRTAAAFIEMEERNSRALRSVLWPDIPA